jgi:hypothetical protein
MMTFIGTLMTPTSASAFLGKPDTISTVISLSVAPANRLTGVSAPDRAASCSRAAGQRR